MNIKKSAISELENYFDNQIHEINSKIRRNTWEINRLSDDQRKLKIMRQTLTELKNILKKIKQ